jgi:hypothetical protein
MLPAAGSRFVGNSNVDIYSDGVYIGTAPTSTDFCIEALKVALRRGRPEIFNGDQGVQFTGERFTAEVAAKEIAISMDGRGCCMDNIFIERLWRSLKYEEVYLKDYESVTEARTGIEPYFRFCNEERLHQSLATGHRRRSTLHQDDDDDQIKRDTRTEDRAPQGCDPSAGPSAGMARGGFDSEAAANSTTDPSDRKLIASKDWS